MGVKVFPPVDLSKMTDELPSYETIIDGQPLTREMCIIGALVRRLGGTVVLSMREMEEVQGVVLYPSTEGLRIDAGNDA
jgi:hypothetical protein